MERRAGWNRSQDPDSFTQQQRSKALAPVHALGSAEAWTASANSHIFLVLSSEHLERYTRPGQNAKVGWSLMKLSCWSFIQFPCLRRRLAS